MVSAFSSNEAMLFFGFLGAAAFVFLCMRLAYRTTKSGVGMASMGMRDKLNDGRLTRYHINPIRRDSRQIFMVWSRRLSDLAGRHQEVDHKSLLQSDDLYQYVLETSVYSREPEPMKEFRELTAKHPGSFMSYSSPDCTITNVHFI
ncbi:transcription factor bHLH95-like [Hibiscus syriacus]|uniref:Transcription factor bHLH95-like n=1 Tax=Hibiscus syriacus TaxID=106335 RepID=A0A6A2Y6L2_HIBSY|nr:transcription factor bHLH95-like [Hibiscus syriacus]